MRMYHTLPLFSFNAKLWRFVGFIEFEGFRPIMVVVVNEVLIIVSECLYMFYNIHDMSAIAIGLFMTAIHFDSVVRILSVMRNQWKLINFLELVKDWYTELEMGDDMMAGRILKDIPKRASIISVATLALGSTGCVATALIPFFLEERSLPYDMYVPNHDSLKSPLYQILYATESFVSMPFVILSYIPFTNLFISWLIFGISLLQILRHKLEALPHDDDEEMLKQLKELIKFHHRIIEQNFKKKLRGDFSDHVQSIIKYFEEQNSVDLIYFDTFIEDMLTFGDLVWFSQTVESLVSFVCLVELVLFTLMLCVLLASFLLMDNLMSKVATCIYISCMLYALFIPYWYSNEFSSESLKVADAAYSINWTQSSTKVRKCILILMIRSQTSLKIRAGGTFPMTLEAFQSLLNATYTYFNMMRGMMAK